MPSEHYRALAEHPGIPVTRRGSPPSGSGEGGEGSAESCERRLSSGDNG